jgi:phage terminase large subunit-like protein
VAKYNAAAQQAITFIETLSLVGDRSGDPVKLLPFQKQIIATIFGKLDRKGRRLIKRAFLFLPRKQAKTFLVACIVLYWLLGRGLRGQQCLSIANDKEQAALLFRMAQQIIEQDEDLGEFTEIVPSTKRITVPAAYSFYSALSSESTTKTGFNPSLVIIDEAQDIRDADLVKNITTGRTERDDYLTIFVGTAGKRKDTPFYAEYEYAKKWKAGIIKNENYAAWIYEADEGDDWESEKTWKKVMPAYGKFCKPSSVREEYELAKQMEHKKGDFLQYLLNVWQVYAGVKWVSDDVWMQNAAPPLHDAAEYWAGFDGASVRDTSSLVLYGKNSRGLWDVIPFVWVCRAQVEARTGTEFSYEPWERAGYLRVTEGYAQDQERIAKDIEEIATRYKIRQTSVDRAGLSWLAGKFQAIGINPVGFAQNVMAQSEPIKLLERQALRRELCHGGHPVLRWMVNNIKTYTDGADNMKFTKKHSEDKIDAPQALANAAGIAFPTLSAEEFGAGQSVYESRGLLVL